MRTVATELLADDGVALVFSGPDDTGTIKTTRVVFGGSEWVLFVRVVMATKGREVWTVR